MRWLDLRTSLGLRRLSVNTALQLTGQLLPLAAAAVAIPLIYRNIGVVDFGIFTIALSGLGLFSILDLGLGRACVRFMARALAMRDGATAASILAQSVVFLGAASLGLAVAMLLLSPAVAAHWIRSPPGKHGIVEQCLVVLTAAMPIGAMTSVFRSTLEAREDFLSIGVIQSAVGASTYIVPLVLSYLGGSLPAIVAGAVACRLIGLIAYVAKSFAAWPDGFPWRGLSLRAHKEFRDFSFWTIGSNLVGAGIVYGDRALLVRLFGLAEIPFYNVPLEFFGRMMILINALATVIFPALSRVSDNRALFERGYVAFVTLLGSAAGVILLIATLATPEILLHWLGKSFLLHSTPIVRILMVGLEFQCLNVLALASLNARGVSRPIMIMHIAEVPFYFAAMAYSGLRFGLAGIAMVWSARLIAEFLCFTFFQLRLLGRGFARPQRIGSALAAANAIPLMMVAAWDRAAAAVLASTLIASVAVMWSLSELRGAGFGRLSSHRA
jgi:O-antigen/teichoic acid export membrane protein